MLLASATSFPWRMFSCMFNDFFKIVSVCIVELIETVENLTWRFFFLERIHGCFFGEPGGC